MIIARGLKGHILLHDETKLFIPTTSICFSLEFASGPRAGRSRFSKLRSRSGFIAGFRCDEGYSKQQYLASQLCYSCDYGVLLEDITQRYFDNFYLIFFSSNLKEFPQY